MSTPNTSGGEMVEERPTIHVLMATTGPWPPRTEVINLLDVPWYQSLGWMVVMRDPVDMDAWDAWRAKHPEATA